MKLKFSVITSILALLAAAVIPSIAQTTYTSQSGVSLFTAVSATATQTSPASRLPNFSGVGTLTIVESGITGSPSGCTVTLAYQSNNVNTAGSTVATVSFTPSTGVQSFQVFPGVSTGDQYVATYACSSTYPTAGLLNITFSPSASMILANIGDPCENPSVTKSSVSVAISTATTTQLVALSAGKVVYACGFTASVGATTTAQFEYGTGTTCGTGTTVLTGAFAPATGAVLGLSGEGSRFATPAGNALCVLSTGTGGINGVLTFVQQ
jgi:hypothetical protein